MRVFSQTPSTARLLRRDLVRGRCAGVAFVRDNNRTLFRRRRVVRPFAVIIIHYVLDDLDDTAVERADTYNSCVVSVARAVRQTGKFVVVAALNISAAWRFFAFGSRSTHGGVRELLRKT